MAIRSRLHGLMRTDHGRIARDMSAIFMFILLAKVAAAAKEMVVAWRYGTGPIVDAYLFVFNTVGIPIVVWYSVLNVVLIPLSARLASSEPEEARRFKAELAGATLLFGAGLALLIWAALRFLLASVSLGLEGETLALAAWAADWLVLLITMGLLANYAAVLLMAGSRHVNSLLEGAPALGLLLVLLFWHGGLAALLWGTLAGGALHLLLSLAAARHRRVLPSPRLGFASPVWREFRAGVGTMLVAQLMLGMMAFVDQLFAADLGTGSISALGYSTRILSLFLTLGATTIGRAMLPVFSRIRQTDEHALPGVAVQWTAWCFLAGGVAVLVGWAAAEWMVMILFERGAFTSADTVEVAEVLRWGLLQMPFYFGAMAAQQALFSFSRYRLAAALAAVVLATKVLFNFLLVPAYGLAGLMMATAAMQAVSFAVMGYALNRMRLRARERA